VILPEVLVLPRPLFFSPPICSFLKEIDDVDVIDITTWSYRDVQRLTALSTFRMTQETSGAEGCEIGAAVSGGRS
jgi:hypothetical protein